MLGDSEIKRTNIAMIFKNIQFDYKPLKHITDDICSEYVKNIFTMTNNKQKNDYSVLVYHRRQ